jgi:hypothetical protein
MTTGPKPAFRRRILALVLLAVPNLAGARDAPAFSIRNDTKAPIRCMILEGGPITQLVTLRPGREHVERIAPGQQVSLVCPQLRATFGPYAAGRYVLRAAKGRVGVARTPGKDATSGR